MKPPAILLLSLLFFIEDSRQLENLINTPTHKCMECLCHARTGCFSRLNCAVYSISFEYWRQAGSPTLNVNDPENQASYNACMLNENCVLNTIKLYTDGYKRPECDCNDIYDCRDMLMLHLHGDNCTKTISETYRSRYNNCATNTNLSQIDAINRCTPDAQ